MPPEEIAEILAARLIQVERRRKFSLKTKHVIPLRSVLAQKLKDGLNEAQMLQLLGFSEQYMLTPNACLSFSRIADDNRIFNIALETAERLRYAKNSAPSQLVQAIEWARIIPEKKTEPRVPAKRLEDYILLAEETINYVRESKVKSYIILKGTLDKLTDPPEEIASACDRKEHDLECVLGSFKHVFYRAYSLNVVNETLTLGLKAYQTNRSLFDKMNPKHPAFEAFKAKIGKLIDPGAYLLSFIKTIELLKRRRVRGDFVKIYESLLEMPMLRYIPEMVEGIPGVLRLDKSPDVSLFKRWYSEVQGITLPKYKRAFSLELIKGISAFAEVKSGDVFEGDRLVTFRDELTWVYNNFERNRPVLFKDETVPKVMERSRTALCLALKKGTYNDVISISKEFRENAAFQVLGVDTTYEPISRFHNVISEIFGIMNDKKQDYGCVREILFDTFRSDYVGYSNFIASEIRRAISMQGFSPETLERWYALAKNIFKIGELPTALIERITSTYFGVSNRTRSITDKVIFSGELRIYQTVMPEMLGLFNSAPEQVDTNSILGFWNLIKQCEAPPPSSNPTKHAEFRVNMQKAFERYCALNTPEMGFAERAGNRLLAVNSDLTIAELATLIETMPKLFSYREAGMCYIDHLIRRRSEGINLDDYIKHHPPENLALFEGKVVQLKEVSEVLLQYASAHAEMAVKIESIDQDSPRIPTTDGKTIFLPPRVAHFEDDMGKNFGFYKALVAYQTGMIEFGSFSIDLDKARQRISQISSEASTLEDIFLNFPNPQVGLRAYYITELARISGRLCRSYPGLLEHLSSANEIVVKALKGNNDFERFMDSLLAYGLTLEHRTAVPVSLEQKTAHFFAAIDRLRSQDATALDSLEVAYGISEMFRDVSVTEDEVPEMALKNASLSIQLNLEVPQEPEKLGKAFKYKEWDHNTGGYSVDLVSLREEEPSANSRIYLERFAKRSSDVVKMVIEQFRRIRPKDKVVVRNLLTGEIDYDQVVKAKADINAGVNPSEKLYRRTYKNRRSVAVGLLGDISGSNADFINGTDIRAADLLRDAFFYFSEGLAVIGDPNALFVYSGKGRDNVTFYKIKDFDEPYDAMIAARISSLRPLENNRDGAGIRHATELLLKQPYKTKILIYLSDFKPHDTNYQKEYALQDTLHALREATLKGVYPLVIVSGNDLQEPLYQVEEMRHLRYIKVTNRRDVPLVIPQIYLKLTK